MNPNCLYAKPEDWTRVAAVQGEAANHYTNDAGLISTIQYLDIHRIVQAPNGLSTLPNAYSMQTNTIYLNLYFSRRLSVLRIIQKFMSGCAQIW